MDAIKPGRKDRYTTASDGYRVPQKIYNVMCQEILLMPVKSKALSYTGTVPPGPSKGKGLRITWREPLGDIRLIERKPQYVDFPRKCSDLKADLKADRQAGAQAKKKVAGWKPKQMSYAPNGKLTRYKVAGGKSSPNTAKMEDVTRQSIMSFRPPARVQQPSTGQQQQARQTPDTRQMTKIPRLQVQAQQPGPKALQPGTNQQQQPQAHTQRAITQVGVLPTVCFSPNVSSGWGPASCPQLHSHRHQLL